MSDVKITKEVAKPEPVPPYDLFAPFGKWMTPFLDPFLFTRALPGGIFAPAVDVKMTDGTMLITADLPGLKKEEIKIEATDKALILEGERKTDEKEEKPGYYKLERTRGKFYREIPLPEGAKVDLAKADLVNGVLTVSLPVTEVKKGRQIPIEEGGKAKPKAA